MILRKPYAILIKNFRLIHVILSILIGYLVYKTSGINNFFNTYMASPITLIDPEQTQALTGLLVFIVPFFMIIGSVVIMILMRFKEKPITFYFVNIIIAILSIVVYAYVHSVLVTLEISLVDVRTLKLCQDFTRSLFVLQSISALITIIRATGFNLKKFDFSKDLEELEIEEEDNEEFEVNVEVDSDKYKRNFNRFKRYTRYILKENKLLLAIVTFIILVLIGLLVYLNIFVYNKVYKETDTVYPTEFALTVKNSFKTNYDYKGDSEEQYTYVIVPFSIMRMTINKTKLETAKFYLYVKGHKFYHQKNLSNNFFDLGTGYRNEKIPSDWVDYNFVFKIPNNFMNDKMQMIYDEGLQKYKFNLNPELLDKDQNTIDIKIKEDLDLSDSILKKSTFRIDSIDFNSVFTETYNFCPAADVCYEAQEHLIPTYKGRDNKILLKLTGSYTVDETLKIEDIHGFSNFIQKFGKIRYHTGTSIHTLSGQLEMVKPLRSKKNDTYYIEVPESMQNAEQVWIDFYIRGRQYKYIIK